MKKFLASILLLTSVFGFSVLGFGDVEKASAATHDYYSITEYKKELKERHYVYVNGKLTPCDISTWYARGVKKCRIHPEEINAGHWQYHSVRHGTAHN